MTEQTDGRLEAPHLSAHIWSGRAVYTLSAIRSRVATPAARLYLGGLLVVFLVVIAVSAARRHDLSHLPFNLLLVVQAIAGSFIVVLAACTVGRRLLRAVTFEPDAALALPVSLAVGAGVFSMVGTTLAFVGLAYEWVLATVLFVAIGLCRSAMLVVASDVARAVREFVGTRPEQRWLAAAAGVIWLRELGWYVRAPVDTDTLAYHLTVLQDVLRDHATHFNYFAYQGGFSLGWHFYSLFAFVVGGARGVAVLVAWFVVGVYYVVFVIVGRRMSPRVGVGAACVSAVLIALVQGLNNHTSNDVPLAFIELCGLLVALGQAGSAPVVVRAALTGLLFGYAVGIKINSIGAAAFGFAALAWSIPSRRRVTVVLVAALCAAPLAGVWPLRALLAVGVPFPHPGVLGGATHMKPQQLEVSSLQMALDVEMFRQWAVATLTSLSPALAIIAVGLALLVAYRRVALFQDILAFGGFRWLIVTAATFGSYALHPWYNLTSTLSLGMVAAAGWAYGLRAPTWDYRKALAYVGIVLVLTSFSWKALRAETKALFFDALFLPSEARGSHADVFRWVSEHLPSDARLAGEAIETFYSHRRYLQIQPAAQGQIDLSGSPAAILAELRTRGVTHLHMSRHLDIPADNEWLVRKWLASFEAIPHVFDLQPVYEKDGERIYDIRTLAAPPRSGREREQ